jgi:hypothetical protein
VGDRTATVGIGANVIGHVRHVAFEMAEVARWKNVFAEIVPIDRVVLKIRQKSAAGSE